MAKSVNAQTDAPSDDACCAPGCTIARKYKMFCSSHGKRFYRHGEIDTSPIKVRDSTSYGAIHRRVIRLKGSATRYRCALCDSPAAQWAYDHTDPEPRHGKSRRNGEGMAYSLDVDRYLPLCVGCHVLFDLALSAVRRGARMPVPVLGQQLRWPL